MKKVYICPSCGSISSLEEGSGKFCPRCGTRMSFSGYNEDAWELLPEEQKAEIAAELSEAHSDMARDHAGTQYQNAPTTPAGNRGKMKCPRCKGRNLTILTEGDKSSTNAILGWLLAGPMAACMLSTQNTARTFWMCQDCGEKFRDMNELETFAKSCGTRVKVLIGLGAALAIIIGIGGSFDGYFFQFLLVGLVCAAIIIVPAILIISSKKRKALAEYDRIKRALNEG